MAIDISHSQLISYERISRTLSQRRKTLLTYALCIISVICIVQIIYFRRKKLTLYIYSSTIYNSTNVISSPENPLSNSLITNGSISKAEENLLNELFIPIPPENYFIKNSKKSKKLNSSDLYTLSAIIYKNISRDVQTLEKIMQRSPNQDEYVKIKEKYFSEEYYRKKKCLVDIGDLLPEPRIHPVEAEGCSTPLLTINDGGRMGNKISQYLSLFVLNTLYNANIAIYPKMDAFLKRMFEDRSIPIIPLFCENTLQRKDLTYTLIYKYLAEQRLFSKKLNNTYEYKTVVKDPHIYIKNYPCPIHILMNRREMLKKELKLLPSLLLSSSSKINELANKEFRGNSTLVSIHVRRTDYEQYAENHSNKLLSMNYYRRAMDFFRDISRFGTVLFMVFSDDIQWCKKNFISEDIVFAGNGDVSNPFIDFAMMRGCDHHILGLGTFSFTAALLGDGLIVYPLPTVPREIVFSTQSEGLCSESPDVIPIPDVP